MTWRTVGLIAVAVLSLTIAVSAPFVARHNASVEPTFDSTLTLPVRVRVSPSLWSSNANDVREAVDFWNQSAGCTAILLVADGEDVRLGWQEDDGPCGGLALDAQGGGSTWYCRDGSRDIRMRALETNAAARLAHECGHALLHRGHDPAGIMGASVESFGSAFVSERDRRELQLRCP